MALAKISSRAYNSFIQKCLLNKSFNKSSKIISQNFATEVHSVEDIRVRVLKIVSSYDKIVPNKVKAESHFLQDLGLDSLDHVEIMMAMEDEFGFEIPDSDAEKLLKPDDIIEYVAKRENIEAAPRDINDI